jgi:hypothetical protein
MRLHELAIKTPVKVVHVTADSLRKLALAWVRIFWRLGIVPKIVATAGEVFALYWVSRYLPVSPADQRLVIDYGAVLLCLFTVFAIVLSPNGRR